MLSPACAAQVRNLQSSADSATRGKEQQLRAFLQDAASKEHAGSPIVVLPTEPFKGLEQQVGWAGLGGSAARQT